MTKEHLIDLEPDQLGLLEQILKRHIPNKTVWAYGSRVTWKADERSDLDLTVFDCDLTETGTLKDALEESNLLVSVDVMNWESIPENFKENIREKYVVLQEKTKLEGWREVRLGEVVKSNQQSIDKNYTYPIIQYLDTSSITEGKIESLQTFNISEAPSRAKRLVKNNDIIYSTVRPIQRHYGFIKNPVQNLVVSTGFSVIETDKLKAESLFIYYLLTSKNIVEKLDSIAEGMTSVYPSLKPSDIENLETFLPPLHEQKAIAEVLSSLDDKIDLLHRQNKTLEDMAQTLFRKWFIDEIDEGWKIGKIEDLIQVLSGFAFKGSSFVEKGKYRLVTIKNVQNGFLDLTRTNNLEQIPERMPDYCLLSKGDILLSLTGNVGRCCLVTDENLLLNQRVAKLQAKDDKNLAFAYVLFRRSSMRRVLEDLAKGTAQSNLSPIETANMEIKIPPSSILQTFSDSASPLLEKVLKNKYQINILENLRDTLLPKLISGDVRVKN